MILAKKYSLPLWLFFFCLFTILFISCGEKEFYEFSGKTMGTDYSIKYSATLPNQSNNKDPELTRYVVSLLGWERRLSKRNKQMSLLGERIEQTQRQLAHYDIGSETLNASIASIYSDLISPLGTPIQVAGEPKILKQPLNQQKIRALLLAGIRSAVLWRQVGGKRRNILFARAKIVACAQDLLKRIS